MTEPLSKDDDLLSPALTRADDAVDFDRPWNPSWLTLAAFFGGLAAGGWLLAENYRRLGQPEKRWPLFAALAVGWLAITIGSTWLHFHGWPGWYTAGDVNHQRNARFATRMFTLGIALAVTAQQQARWRIWAAHGGAHAPLLRPALIAIGAATVAQMGIVWAMAEAFEGGQPQP